MKTAKSLIYGGELIDAIDCDYDDFRSLMPLCPNCNESVFLRKESDRVSKLGKKFQVPKHWVHFDSTSEEQKASCEERVGNYTEADRQRIQRKARGQRLKLIQRWFWKAFVNGYPLGNIEEALASLEPKEDPFSSKNSYLISWYLRSSKTSGFNQLVEDQVKKAFNPKRHFMLNDDEDEKMAELIQAPLMSIDRQLHLKICQEIGLFLATKKQEDLLSSLVYLSSSTVVSELKRKEVDFKSVYKEYFAAQVTVNILLYIALTPWASEFEKLEAAASQSKGSLKKRRQG